MFDKFNSCFMSTTANLTIRSKANKKDLYNIVIRIIHNRQNSTISTGTFVDEGNWNEKKSCIHSKCKLYNNIALVNSNLTNQLSKVRSTIMELERSGHLADMDIRALITHINPKKSDQTVIDFLGERQKYYYAIGKIATSMIYKSTIAFLNNSFCGNITFEEFTTDKIESLRKLHIFKNKKSNGNCFGNYIHKIQKTYRLAIKTGNVLHENKQLLTYAFKRKETAKRAIEIDYIKKLVSYQCKPGTMEYHSRNLFIFMYLQAGINIKDVVHLKVGNIAGERLFFVRHKTEKPFNMPLAPRSIDILNEYSAGKGPDEYIFPILKVVYDQEPDKSLYFIKRYGVLYSSMKNLGDKIGLPVRLTTYISRHSWASHARDANIPMAAIQGGLGHKSQRTTEIYLNEISANISDNAFKTVSDNLG